MRYHPWSALLTLLIVIMGIGFNLAMALTHLKDTSIFTIHLTLVVLLVQTHNIFLQREP